MLPMFLSCQERVAALNRAAEGSSRLTLHTGTDLLTDKRRLRLQTPLGSDENFKVEVTWVVYQRLIAAYREPDRERERGRELMRQLIDLISRGVPAALTEVIMLGRTLTNER